MNLKTGKFMNQQNAMTTPITKTMISKVKEMAKKQGIEEIKHHNKDTDLMSPNVDWEFGKECNDYDDD